MISLPEYVNTIENKAQAYLYACITQKMKSNNEIAIFHSDK